MTSILDRLNLRPQERRLVVLTFTLFFVMINLWFVRPHFRDWGALGTRLESAHLKLKRYQSEVAQLPQYEARRKQLEAVGSDVLPAEQSIQLLRTVEQQAIASKVNVTYRGAPTVIKPSGPATNSFFEEMNLTLRVNTGEPELLDFLYTLGAGNSLIRVNSLELHPAAGGTLLDGNLTLTATYQRKPPVKAPPTAARAAATPVKKP